MKNILLLTNEFHLAEVINAVYYARHHFKWARSGAVGYAVIQEWKPELVLVAELDDCHAGSVAHTITMRAKKRPFMVAMHRPFDYPEQDLQYETRCLEMGYDQAVKVPVHIDFLLMWAESACLREVEEWPGKQLLSLPSSSSGGSCTSFTR